MALNFPSSPSDGDIYPDPAPAGSTQYVYNASKGTWLTVFRGVERVSGNAPIFVSGEPSAPAVNIFPATQSAAGSMSAADKTKLDNLGPGDGTVKEIAAGVGLGAPNTGDKITTAGTISLLPASINSLGGVRAGANVEITPTGTLTVRPPSSLVIGGVKQGTGLQISADGTVSLAPNSTYTVLDNIASGFNGTQTQFQMRVNGVPFAPSSFNALLIFVGGIIQVPLSSYTLSSSFIIFTSPPPAGASFYGISLT